MKINIKDETIQTMCLAILTAIAVTGALHWLRPVMIPVVLAMMISLILTPAIDLQMKYLKSPRWLALGNTLIVGILLLFLMGLLFTVSFNHSMQNAEAYQDEIEKFLNRTSEWIKVQFGIDFDGMIGPFIQNLGRNTAGMVKTVLNAVLDIFSQGLLVAVFVIFLLLGKGREHKSSKEWREGEERVKRYVLVKIGISSVTGALVWLTLIVLGVDLSLLFGFLAFVLNFIPTIGPVIATLLPLPVVLAQPEIPFWKGALAIAIPGALQFFVGNILETKILGDVLDLHPVVVLMALIFWGMIWGIPGMFLAVPLTAVMQIIFSHFTFTAPLAALLAGRLNEKQVE